MIYLDNTQSILSSYLNNTEKIMNHLLESKPFCGIARILTNLDLGFPHDVVRLAGGFATGICVSWQSEIPFIPIDICMNVCTVSLYELGDYVDLKEEEFKKLTKNLNASSYISNFHRGNHFISLLEDIYTSKYYIMIHSSAAEFETLYNGLYPVEGNFFHSNINYYHDEGIYVRYLSGKSAELFYRLIKNAYEYNQNRHDFIINSLLGNVNLIVNCKHYHHYGMPDSNIALLGSHIIGRGQETPLLTREGENVYLIKYHDIKEKKLQLFDNKKLFITPHGLGKQHCRDFKIYIDEKKKYLQLDSLQYKIKYGESLREHPGLRIRTLDMKDYFKKLSSLYSYSILSEFKQIISYNKNGFIRWK